MAAFDYTAMDTQGRKKKGVLHAESERFARAALREQKLLPICVQRSEQDGIKPAPFRITRRIGNAELADFTRQFAVLVESGIPVDEALDTVARQQQALRIKRFALGLRADILEGLSLSDALSRQHFSFEPIYPAMVMAGERSGSLGPVMIRLADHLDGKRELDQHIRNALVYPAVLIAVAVSIIALLMAYVVPKVTSQFERADQALPWMTEFLILLSDGLRDYGFFVLLTCAGLLLSVKIAMRKERARAGYERTLFRLPGVHTFLCSIGSARLARSMDIMLSSGMPVLDALEVSSASVGNAEFRRQIEHATERISEGQSMSDEFSKLAFLPPLLVSMVGNGERSGELAKMFSRAATILEQSVASRIKLMLTLFEPFLILIMGGIVLFIVMAILLPILELNNMAMF